MAAYAVIQEIVWIRGVMTELGLKGFQLSKDASPTILNMDSKSAIDLAQNPINHKRSKHIRIKYHWIREQVGGNIIRLNHVPTAEMTADMMTKAHKQFASLLHTFQTKHGAFLSLPYPQLLGVAFGQVFEVLGSKFHSVDAILLLLPCFD